MGKDLMNKLKKKIKIKRVPIRTPRSTKTSLFKSNKSAIINKKKLND